MKISFILLLLLTVSFLSAQNVGINTINPQEQLHLRSDSTKMAMRFDNKKSPQGFNYFTETGTPSSLENIIIISGATNWPDLNHTKIINSDNTWLNSPSLGIFSNNNPLRVNFSFSNTIPANAEIINMTVLTEWKSESGINAQFPLSVSMYLKNSTNHSNLALFESFVTSTSDVIEELVPQTNFAPITAAMLNASQVYLQVSAGLISPTSGTKLQIDKISLEVEYRIPLTAQENVSWSAGIKEGTFNIANSNDLNSNQFLKIDESGTTQLKSLRILKNAGAGKILTSNQEGKAYWVTPNSILPGANLWLAKRDTVYYEAGPVQVNNATGSAALIFDNGESKLNNSINLIETKNRLLNIILDADNNQVNEQFNIYKDSTEFLAQLPAIRFGLDGNDSWINGGGNIGIGRTTPQEKLDVNGAIRISNTTNTAPQAGTIRYNATKKEFEGYNGIKWLSMSTNTGFGDKLGNEQQGFTGVNGKFVDVHGATAVATKDGATDSVVIYDFNGSSWVQATVLQRSNFTSLSVHDNTMITDNAVFKKVAGSWSLNYFIPLSASPILSGDVYETKYVVGGLEKAELYEDNGTTWLKTATLTASDNIYLDLFGSRTSVWGDYIAVSATGDDDNRGSVYIFYKSGSTWIQQAKLMASDGNANEYFGNAIDLKSNYLIVGAPYKTENGFTYGGAVYIFERSGTAWTQQAKLNFSQMGLNDFCGYSVKLSSDGTTAVVGCPEAGPNLSLTYNSGPGRVHVFTRNGNNWEEEYVLTASDKIIEDAFGHSVSLHGNTIIAGAPGKNNDAGKIYFFEK